MNALEQYKTAVTLVYKKLSTHYQALFYKGAKEDRAKHLLQWIQTVAKAGLSLDKLDEFTEYLIHESIAYSKFSPNSVEYVEAFNEWMSMNSDSSNEMTGEFKEQFDRVYKKLSLRYENLWARNEVGTIEAHNAFWREEVFSSGVTEASLMPAVDRIRKMAQFRTFPPNVDQYIDVAKIAGREDKVPAVEEAYEIAVSSKNGSAFHPLIKHVRAKFGYVALVDGVKYGVKNRFEMAYREALTNYLDGRLDIKTDDVGEEESQVAASPESITSTLDDILAGLAA